MINTTKLAMLHHGALIQVAERIQTLETKIEERYQNRARMDSPYNAMRDRLDRLEKALGI